jgi:aminopeptidase-like protein
LVEPNWAKAFREKIFSETNSYDFTYYIAITKIKKNKGQKIEEFKNCNLFLNNLSDNGKNKVKIEFLTLEEMLSEIFIEKADTTIEATEIGRFMQLIKAADLKLIK